MQITSIEIKQVKRLAKQLESTYPELKLGQRLDKAATQHLGVRDYHEAYRLYDKWVMFHVHASEDADRVSKCAYCEFSFAPDIKADLQSHRKIHDHFHEACVSLGYQPGNYVQRELMKHDGREQAASGQSVEIRVEGVLMLLRGWFDRSLADAIHGKYWRKHPTFEVYVAMILDTLGSSYGDLQRVLKERYGYLPGVIQAGNSYWYPRND
ncbi:hypothetical protein [Pseudomonas sp. lyk4-TYG-107]|uniref:hypothetical protein n=1 Tax=Pseudomonas sp. lyk4-TYG-107 TaxID=3040317 RepID=UPI002553636A|nr:hypothetical protein [Pseudomonas sp. lyk4-TYG-107]